MNAEQENSGVGAVEGEGDRDSLDARICARLTMAFEAMGPQARAMLRLFSLCQSIGGIASHTPAERFTNDWRYGGRPEDALYGDEWLAGFSACLEMVIEHT